MMIIAMLSSNDMISLEAFARGMAINPVKIVEIMRNLRRANPCLLYTSPSPRDRQKSRMPSSA